MTVKLNHNITTDLFIRGAWYTPTTTVVIPGITVNSITINTDNELVVNITTPSVDGFHDVEVTNESGTTVFTNGIQVELSVWEDLRTGGTTLNIGTDIRFRTGMTMVRDAQGISFTGLNPWQSWVKVEKYPFTRASNSTLQWIFTGPTANFMIGIGSDATNETNNSQFSQAETEAYFNSATNFWGLYGNNGTIGGAGNQSNGSAVATANVYKIKFTNSGSVGGVFTLYQLPSANPADWDDETNVINSFTIGGTLNPDEVNLFPFIIPRSGGVQRFIALKLE